MAVRIPIYEQQTLPQGEYRTAANPATIVGAENRLPDAVGIGVERFGKGLSDVGTAVSVMDATNAATRVTDGLAKAEEQWSITLNDRKNKAQEGAPNFHADLMKDFDKYSQESLSNETSERGKLLLTEGLASLRKHLSSQALGFQVDANVAMQHRQMTDSSERWNNIVMADPSQYERAKKALLSGIAVMPLDPVSKYRIAEPIIGKLSEAATLGGIQQNAEVAHVELKGEPRVSDGFEGAVNFTLAHEGGLNSADTNGTPSNFGINQKAHPEVDVKGLTADGARAIYRKDYWDAIGGDKLMAQNPKLALVAFDTAVMSGTAKAEQLVAQSGGDPAKFMELRADYLNSLVKSDPGKYGKYTKAWTSRNRDLRNQLLPDGTPPMSGNGYVDDLSYDARVRLQNIAETRVKQNESVFRQGLQSRLSNAATMAKDGIVDPNPITLPEFQAAYGPEDGLRAHSQYLSTQDMARDVSGFKAMPQADMVKVLENTRPAPGPDYESQSSRFDVRLQAYQAVLKQRNDDPATYVLANSQPVRDAYQRMTGVISGQNPTPEALNESARLYADASLAEQKRLGVVSPQILDKPYIDQVGHDFQNTKNGDDVARKLDTMKTQWGSYWPDVMRQLSQAKALPAGAEVIASTMSGRGAADMAIASRMKDDEFLTGRDDAKEVMKSVDDKLAENMEEFRFSMIGSDGTPRLIGGNDKFNLFYGQARKLALYYTSQGLREADAAKKAADAVINEHYNFHQTYRIPVAQDQDAIIEGADYMKANLASDRVKLPGYVKGNPFMIPGYMSSIKRASYWVTNPDETGLVLINPDTRKAVEDADGNPIQYTWSALATAKKKNAGLLEGAAFGEGMNHPSWAISQ